MKSEYKKHYISWKYPE